MIKHAQTVRLLLPTNCLSVFDYFVGLPLIVLIFNPSRPMPENVRKPGVFDISRGYIEMEHWREIFLTKVFLKVFPTLKGAVS